MLREGQEAYSGNACSKEAQPLIEFFTGIFHCRAGARVRPLPCMAGANTSKHIQRQAWALHTACLSRTVEPLPMHTPHVVVHGHCSPRQRTRLKRVHTPTCISAQNNFCTFRVRRHSCTHAHTDQAQARAHSAPPPQTHTRVRTCTDTVLNTIVPIYVSMPPKSLQSLWKLRRPT